MIRNFKDLAALVSASPTINSISRRIYKSTTCGAHVNIVTPQTCIARRKTVTVRAHGRIAIDGYRWLSFTVNGKKTEDKKTIEEIAEYLEAKKVNNTLRSPWDIKIYVERALKAKKTADLTGRLTGHLNLVLKFKFDLPVFKTFPEGISIGSIVEGVDYGTETQNLTYPFSAKAFWAAISHVEQEAKNIWNDTHGCPKCGLKNPETGERAINPKCKACKGEGIIL
jgi:hypothetical protein